MLWHCWLGVRKSIWPAENWVMRCWCGYLSGARYRLFAYGPADATAIPKPHPLLPYLNPDWFYFSGTDLPGWPGKEAAKRLCSSSYRSTAPLGGGAYPLSIYITPSSGFSTPPQIEGCLPKHLWLSSQRCYNSALSVSRLKTYYNRFRAAGFLPALCRRSSRSLQVH